MDVAVGVWLSLFDDYSGATAPGSHWLPDMQSNTLISRLFMLSMTAGIATLRHILPRLMRCAVKKFARLTMLCRGATLSNRTGGFNSDETVLPMEVTKAQRIARLKSRYDAVITAPERSAIETAAVFQADVSIESRVGDLSYGEWKSRTLQEIADADPQALQSWLQDPEAAPHGGESLAQLFGRVSDWMDELRDAGGHTLVVTHAPVIRAAILAVLGAPLDAFWRIDVEPLAVADIRSDGRRWALRSLGHVAEAAK
jgi:broad specificity phosphatase PhoE